MMHGQPNIKIKCCLWRIFIGLFVRKEPQPLVQMPLGVLC